MLVLTAIWMTLELVVAVNQTLESSQLVTTTTTTAAAPAATAAIITITAAVTTTTIPTTIASLSHTLPQLSIFTHTSSNSSLNVSLQHSSDPTFNSSTNYVSNSTLHTPTQHSFDPHTVITSTPDLRNATQDLNVPKLKTTAAEDNSKGHEIHKSLLKFQDPLDDTPVEVSLVPPGVSELDNIMEDGDSEAQDIPGQSTNSAEGLLEASPGITAGNLSLQDAGDERLVGAASEDHTTQVILGTVTGASHPITTHQDNHTDPRPPTSHQDTHTDPRPPTSHQDTHTDPRPPTSHQDTHTDPRPPTSHQGTHTDSRPPTSHQHTLTDLSHSTSKAEPSLSHHTHSVREEVHKAADTKHPRQHPGSHQNHQTHKTPPLDPYHDLSYTSPLVLPDTVFAPPVRPDPLSNIRLRSRTLKGKRIGQGRPSRRLRQGLSQFDSDSFHDHEKPQVSLRPAPWQQGVQRQDPDGGSWGKHKYATPHSTHSPHISASPATPHSPHIFPSPHSPRVPHIYASPHTLTSPHSSPSPHTPHSPSPNTNHDSTQRGSQHTGTQTLTNILPLDYDIEDLSLDDPAADEYDDDDEIFQFENSEREVTRLQDTRQLQTQKLQQTRPQTELPRRLTPPRREPPVFPLPSSPPSEEPRVLPLLQTHHPIQPSKPQQKSLLQLQRQTHPQALMQQLSQPQTLAQQPPHQQQKTSTQPLPQPLTPQHPSKSINLGLYQGLRLPYHSLQDADEGPQEAVKRSPDSFLPFAPPRPPAEPPHLNLPLEGIQSLPSPLPLLRKPLPPPLPAPSQPLPLPSLSPPLPAPSQPLPRPLPPPLPAPSQPLPPPLSPSLPAPSQLLSPPTLPSPLAPQNPLIPHPSQLPLGLPQLNPSIPQPPLSSQPQPSPLPPQSPPLPQHNSPQPQPLRSQSPQLLQQLQLLPQSTGLLPEVPPQVPLQSPQPSQVPLQSPQPPQVLLQSSQLPLQSPQQPPQSQLPPQLPPPLQSSQLLSHLLRLTPQSLQLPLHSQQFLLDTPPQLPVQLSLQTSSQPHLPQRLPQQQSLPQPLPQQHSQPQLPLQQQQPQPQLLQQPQPQLPQQHSQPQLPPQQQSQPQLPLQQPQPQLPQQQQQPQPQLPQQQSQPQLPLQQQQPQPQPPQHSQPQLPPQQQSQPQLPPHQQSQPQLPPQQQPQPQLPQQQPPQNLGLSPQLPQLSLANLQEWAAADPSILDYLYFSQGLLSPNYDYYDYYDYDYGLTPPQGLFQPPTAPFGTVTNEGLSQDPPSTSTIPVSGLSRGPLVTASLPVLTLKPTLYSSHIETGTGERKISKGNRSDDIFLPAISPPPLPNLNPVSAVTVSGSSLSHSSPPPVEFTTPGSLTFPEDPAFEISPVPNPLGASPPPSAVELTTPGSLTFLEDPAFEISPLPYPPGTRVSTPWPPSSPLVISFLPPAPGLRQGNNKTGSTAVSGDQSITQKTPEPQDNNLLKDLLKLKTKIKAREEFSEEPALQDDPKIGELLDQLDTANLSNLPERKPDSRGSVGLQKPETEISLAGAEGSNPLHIEARNLTQILGKLEISKEFEDHQLRLAEDVDSVTLGSTPKLLSPDASIALESLVKKMPSSSKSPVNPPTQAATDTDATQTVPDMSAIVGKRIPIETEPKTSKQSPQTNLSPRLESLVNLTSIASFSDKTAKRIPQLTIESTNPDISLDSLTLLSTVPQAPGVVKAFPTEASFAATTRIFESLSQAVHNSTDPAFFVLSERAVNKFSLDLGTTKDSDQDSFTKNIVEKALAALKSSNKTDVPSIIKNFMSVNKSFRKENVPKSSSSPLPGVAPRLITSLQAMIEESKRSTNSLTTESEKFIPKDKTKLPRDDIHSETPSSSENEEEYLILLPQNNPYEYPDDGEFIVIIPRVNETDFVGDLLPSLRPVSRFVRQGDYDSFVSDLAEMELGSMERHLPVIFLDEDGPETDTLIASPTVGSGVFFPPTNSFPDTSFNFSGSQESAALEESYEPAPHGGLAPYFGGYGIRELQTKEEDTANIESDLQEAVYDNINREFTAPRETNITVDIQDDNSTTLNGEAVAEVSFTSPLLLPEDFRGVTKEEYYLKYAPSTTPVTSTAPSYLASPLSPVTPASPLSPVTPASSLSPVTPASPFSPVTPASSLSPVTPASSLSPVTPTSSLSPVTPASSLSPVTPASPFSPVTPASPLSPVTPASPFSPVTPASPLSPVTPASPHRHATPSSPLRPATPASPLSSQTPTSTPPPYTVHSAAAHQNNPYPDDGFDAPRPTVPHFRSGAEQGFFYRGQYPQHDSYSHPPPNPYPYTYTTTLIPSLDEVPTLETDLWSRVPSWQGGSGTLDLGSSSGGEEDVGGATLTATTKDTATATNTTTATDTDSTTATATDTTATATDTTTSTASDATTATTTASATHATISFDNTTATDSYEPTFTSRSLTTSLPSTTATATTTTTSTTTTTATTTPTTTTPSTSPTTTTTTTPTTTTPSTSPTTTATTTPTTSPTTTTPTTSPTTTTTTTPTTSPTTTTTTSSPVVTNTPQNYQVEQDYYTILLNKENEDIPTPRKDSPLNTHEVDDRDRVQLRDFIAEQKTEFDEDKLLASFPKSSVDGQTGDRDFSIDLQAVVLDTSVNVPPDDTNISIQTDIQRQVADRGESGQVDKELISAELVISPTGIAGSVSESSILGLGEASVIGGHSEGSRGSGHVLADSSHTNYILEDLARLNRDTETSEEDADIFSPIPTAATGTPTATASQPFFVPPVSFNSDTTQFFIPDYSGESLSSTEGVERQTIEAVESDGVYFGVTVSPSPSSPTNTESNNLTLSEFQVGSNVFLPDSLPVVVLFEDGGLDGGGVGEVVQKGEVRTGITRGRVVSVDIGAVPLDIPPGLTDTDLPHISESLTAPGIGFLPSGFLTPPPDLSFGSDLQLEDDFGLRGKPVATEITADISSDLQVLLGNLQGGLVGNLQNLSPPENPNEPRDRNPVETTRDSRLPSLTTDLPYLELEEGVYAFKVTPDEQNILIPNGTGLSGEQDEAEMQVEVEVQGEVEEQGEVNVEVEVEEGEEQDKVELSKAEDEEASVSNISEGSSDLSRLVEADRDSQSSFPWQPPQSLSDIEVLEVGSGGSAVSSGNSGMDIRNFESFSVDSGVNNGVSEVNGRVATSSPTSDSQASADLPGTAVLPNIEIAFQGVPAVRLSDTYTEAPTTRLTEASGLPEVGVDAETAREEPRVSEVPGRVGSEVRPQLGNSQLRDIDSFPEGPLFVDLASSDGDRPSSELENRGTVILLYNETTSVQESERGETPPDIYFGNTFDRDEIRPLAPLVNMAPLVPGIPVVSSEQTPVLLDLLTRLSAQIKAAPQVPITPTPTLERITETTTTTVFVPVVTATTAGNQLTLPPNRVRPSTSRPFLKNSESSSQANNGDDNLEWIWSNTGSQGEQLPRLQESFTPSLVEPLPDLHSPRFPPFSPTHNRFGLRDKKILTPDEGREESGESLLERWVWTTSNRGPTVAEVSTTSPQQYFNRWIPNNLLASPSMARYSRSGDFASTTTASSSSQPYYWYSSPRQPDQQARSPLPRHSTSFFRLSQTYPQSSSA